MTRSALFCELITFAEHHDRSGRPENPNFHKLESGCTALCGKWWRQSYRRHTCIFIFGHLWTVLVQACPVWAYLKQRPARTVLIFHQIQLEFRGEDIVLFCYKFKKATVVPVRFSPPFPYLSYDVVLLPKYFILFLFLALNFCLSSCVILQSVGRPSGVRPWRSKIK